MIACRRFLVCDSFPSHVLDTRPSGSPMHRVRLLAPPALCVTVLLLAARPGEAADPPKLDLDELAPHPDLAWLRRAKVPTDDAGLAKFLAGLRGPEPDPAEVDRLVKQLRTGPNAEQDAAAAKLTEIGAIAVPVLRRHRLDPDPAAAARVRACLAKVEEAADKPLARPAMRRLVRRQASGAAAALVGYVPFAFDPEAELDAWYGLDELAAKDPKVLAVLAGALADKQPARRALTACILGRRGDAAQRKAAAGLLQDPDPTVRLRAAQGLLAGKDPAGVPTLIELLAHADADVEVRWQAEELLRWLAVDTAPEAVVGAGDPKAAEACRAAWRQWWKDQGQKADVAAAERQPRRPLLLLAYDRKGGRAWVVGCDGVTRHEWTGLDRLADAQYVPGGGVLTLHEQQGAEKPNLAERTPRGQTLWQHSEMANPQYVQRLSNGQLFVAEFELAKQFPRLRYQVLGPGPRVIATQPKAASVIAHAARLTEDGKVVCADLSAPAHPEVRLTELREFDPAANIHRGVGGGGYLIGEKYYLEPTPDRGHLVSGIDEHTGGRAVAAMEYDCFGVVVWKYILTGVTHAYRLHGGTTIACTADRLVELTSDRRMVGETPIKLAPQVARPCLGLIRFGFDTFPANADLEIDIDYRVRSLQRKDPHARLWALKQLAAFGPDAAGMIPKLRAHSDPDPAVRDALKRTLLAIGEEKIPRLIAENKDADAGKRREAVRALYPYNYTPAALDALLAAMSDPDPLVRQDAARFGGVGRDPQSRYREGERPNRCDWAADRIVPALIKLIATDTNGDVRWMAMLSLRAMGLKAYRAVPLLISLAKEDREDVLTRCRALEALARIANGDKDVLDLLYVALADTKHLRLQITAAYTLPNFKAPAKETVRRFLAAYPKGGATKDSDLTWFRSNIRHAIRQIQPDRPDVIEFFTALADDPSSTLGTRLEAAEFLSQVGKRDVAAKYMTKWAAEENLEQRDALKKLAYQLWRAASIARWKDE